MSLLPQYFPENNIMLNIIIKQYNAENNTILKYLNDQRAAKNKKAKTKKQKQTLLNRK